MSTVDELHNCHDGYHGGPDSVGGVPGGGRRGPDVKVSSIWWCLVQLVNQCELPRLARHPPSVPRVALTMSQLLTLVCCFLLSTLTARASYDSYQGEHQTMSPAIIWQAASKLDSICFHGSNLNC